VDIAIHANGARRVYVRRQSNSEKLYTKRI